MCYDVDRQVQFVGGTGKLSLTSGSGHILPTCFASAQTSSLLIAAPLSNHYNPCHNIDVTVHNMEGKILYAKTFR